MMIDRKNKPASVPPDVAAGRRRTGETCLMHRGKAGGKAQGGQSERDEGSLHDAGSRVI